MRRIGRTWPGARWPGLAAAAGALAATGHAPFYLWPLTLLGLAGVTLAVLRAPHGPAWVGLAGGLGYGAVAFSWIVEPFLIEPETYGWMAPFGLAFMAAGLGGFWAGAAALARLSLFRASPALGFALALSVTEHLRGHVLTGFPWAMPGHVWISTPVGQLGAFVGPSGLTLVLLLIAAGFSRMRWRPVLGAVLGLAGLWLVGQGQRDTALPEPGGAVVRLVQPNAEQRLKWDPDQARLFLDRLLTHSAAAPRPDLVIWPETALPYLLERHADLAPLISAAAAGAPVALGVQRAEGGRYWNSLAVIGHDGAIGQRYDKHHLVPFGEYIPLGDLAFRLFGLRAFAAQEGAGYTAGIGPVVLDLGGSLGKVLPLICYEAVFPQDVNGAPERADWILQITNDAWFGTFSGPFQHADQARMRAIEQGLPLVRVANTGVTAVYDARGRVVASLPFGTEAHLDAALPAALPPTPYSRFGEGPFLLLLAGIGLALIAMSRRLPA